MAHLNIQQLASGGGRALVRDHRDLVRSGECLVRRVLSVESGNEFLPASVSCNTPFFLMGQSMGGSIALLLGLDLERAQGSLSRRFSPHLVRIAHTDYVVG